MFQDLRYGVRMLLNNPGVTAVAVLSLALGIGANATMFSVANAVLYRPLAVEAPDRLVSLFTAYEGKDRYNHSSYPDYEDLRDRGEVFSGLAAHFYYPMGLRAAERAEVVAGQVVTWNYFSVLGVEPFLVSSSVAGVLAQRLVRKICKACKEEYEPDPDQLPPDFKYQPGEKLFHGRGCRECRNSGYRGRIGIFELMTINDELRELIVGRASVVDLLEAAYRGGLKPMREDGWAKVRRGEITVEEVARVTKME